MASSERNITVDYLQKITFSRLTLNEKKEIKAIGRPTPDLSIEQRSKSRDKEYTRQFNNNVYEKCDWLCGCEVKNALFCYPCLLFDGDASWTKIGVTDLRHLTQKITKHEQSAKHINSVIDLSMLGKADIAAQIDSGYKLSIAKHNEEVKKNRDTLSKIINCVKFCGKFELPLRGHDESNESKNPGVFLGLIDFTCQLDTSFNAHISNATVFKGTSKTVQNDLLDSMLVICRNRIKEEIRNANFLAVMCDETTDVHDVTQMVIVFRYEFKGKPVERFWGFYNVENQTGQELARVLLKELDTVIGDSHKLIAQTYDGAAALSGIHKGVQTLIKNVYPTAHFIHCYAHQLNLILEKATSQNTSVRVFFNSLSGLPAFFSKSPQRMAALEKVADRRIPRPSSTRWNFKSRTINTVKEIKEEIIECCSVLEKSNSKETGAAAVGIKKMLRDPEFGFWLDFFSEIMPHVDILYNQLQSRNIDATKANTSLNVFSSQIQTIREGISASHEEPVDQRKRKIGTDRVIAAKEVCDVIIMQCRARFSFTEHLEASKLLMVDKFQSYINEFPSDALTQAILAYPVLDGEKLKTELAVLYARPDLSTSNKLTDLLQLINENNLGSTFSETVKLLQILVTTPMSTAEAERCFSTLKRIKTFLRSTMDNERLSALAMISIENNMTTEINNFNEQVIDHYATSKTRRADFIFK